MYDNYVFDLYGTLVDINTNEWKASLWKQMSLFFGYYGAYYKPAELKKAYERIVHEDEEKLKNDVTKDMPNYSHEACPEIQLEYVFQKLFQEKGVDADMPLAVHTGQFFRLISTKYVKLYDGAIELIDNIKAAGKKAWLLSNAQRIFTEYEMRYLGIYDKFDGVLISSDEGTKKPDDRFFRLLTDKFGIDLSKSIMIGNDANTDIAGAQGVGMDTFFIYSNISPQMTPEMVDEVEATYKLDHMDLYEVSQMLGFTKEQSE